MKSKDQILENQYDMMGAIAAILLYQDPHEPEVKNMVNNLKLSMAKTKAMESSKGDWVKQKVTDNDYETTVYICNRCEHEECEPTNFCSNCGADMRQGK